MSGCSTEWCISAKERTGVMIPDLDLSDTSCLTHKRPSNEQSQLNPGMWLLQEHCISGDPGQAELSSPPAMISRARNLSRDHVLIMSWARLFRLWSLHPHPINVWLVLLTREDFLESNPPAPSLLSPQYMTKGQFYKSSMTTIKCHCISRNLPLLSLAMPSTQLVLDKC
jgi:hypothetical protein